MAKVAPFTLGHFEKWARSLILDSGKPWRPESFQLEFVEDVFAAEPKSECWLVVPEGNGKTTLLAGLGLYGLRFAEEARIPIAASTRDQSKILYQQAKGFIRRGALDDPVTEPGGAWFEAFDGWRRIDLRGFNPRNKRGHVLGTLEVFAADASGADGVIPFPFGFLDELHRHKGLDLYETWRGKLEKRGAKLLAISTAGAPGSDFELMRDRLRLSGSVASQRSLTFARVVGPRLVFHEHAVAKNGDVDDLALVAEANPFSGVTAESLSAKRASLTMSDSHWRRFTCNVASQTDTDLFIDLADWDRLGDGTFIDPGAPVCLGADGSRTWDTTVVAWASALADRIDVDCRVFSVVAASPHHVLHQGGKIDFDDVEQFLIGMFDMFAPLETAYDPRYLERSMEIVDRRLPSASIIAVEPSSKHARDAYQALFEAVADGRLRHRGDPVVAAHLANCTADRDERTREIRRLRKIDKSKPIDAVPALALAVWRASQAQPSTYETKEVALV